MKIDKKSAYLIWQIGDKVAKSVPEIAPEIRGAISVVQNPGIELTEAQVKYSLSEILRICKDRSEFLSAVNIGHLYNFFNEVARLSAMDYKVKRIYGMSEYYSNGSPVSYTGIMRELAA